MKYVEIEEGVVINSIIADEAFILTIPGTWVQNDGANIGSLYDGTTFTDPWD
ncbi:hypothetical protein N9F16_00780 [bacterium]|nr:hypothetical protein [bacterium]